MGIALALAGSQPPHLLAERAVSARRVGTQGGVDLILGAGGGDVAKDGRHLRWIGKDCSQLGFPDGTDVDLSRRLQPSGPNRGRRQRPQESLTRVSRSSGALAVSA